VPPLPEPVEREPEPPAEEPEAPPRSPAAGSCCKFAAIFTAEIVILILVIALVARLGS
jgi:hypothetical protein